MILWERHGQWMAWIRQIAPQLAEQSQEVRTAAACWEAMRSTPQAALVIEFPPGQWLLRLQWTHHLSTWGPGPKCLIGLLHDQFSGDLLAAAQAGLHAAGINRVFTSPRDLTALEALVRRHTQAWRAGP